MICGKGKKNVRDMSKRRLDASVSADIVEYLQQQGWSLKTIGSMVGVSESFVSRVKQKTRSFTISRLCKLEQKINLPLPLLLLQAIRQESVPKELRSHYQKLQQVLVASAELGHVLDDRPLTEKKRYKEKAHG